MNLPITETRDIVPLTAEECAVVTACVTAIVEVFKVANDPDMGEQDPNPVVGNLAAIAVQVTRRGAMDSPMTAAELIRKAVAP